MTSGMSTGRGATISLVLHVVLLGAVLFVSPPSVHVVVPHRPGTALGTRAMLVFRMGAPSSGTEAVVHSLRKQPMSAVSRNQQSRQAAPALAAPSHSSQSNGSSGETALGEGDISVALVKFHPRPEPDLSSLARGSAGDVILEATVDAQGKVADLKVSKGFGGQIDQTVLATVQQWTFLPAMKDGVPVASELEILFHYERS